ncbi:hypothetical protein LJC49_06325 [Ruminococcaceae bacterium OttesenSCG-928-I18]|nr:hypothetical protein [Ruminococcaceae bacterium OttesenSCG-928-I18]
MKRRSWFESSLLHERIRAVFAQKDQQILYDIAFCDPEQLVRLAAIYRLNEIHEITDCEMPAGYRSDEEFDQYGRNEGEREYREWYSGPVYGWENYYLRKSAIPYFVSEPLLYQIACYDPHLEVKEQAARRMRKRSDLERLLIHYAGTEMADRIERLLKQWDDGSLPIPAKQMDKSVFEVDKEKVVPSVPPTFDELKETAICVKTLIGQGKGAQVDSITRQYAMHAVALFDDRALLCRLLDLYSADEARREMPKLCRMDLHAHIIKKQSYPGYNRRQVETCLQQRANTYFGKHTSRILTDASWYSSDTKTLPRETDDRTVDEKLAAIPYTYLRLAADALSTWKYAVTTANCSVMEEAQAPFAGGCAAASMGDEDDAFSWAWICWNILLQ